MYDVLIVGAGPAGLTAAVYACRAGFSTLVLGGLPGGQIASTALVENYPGFVSIFGPDLSDKLLEQAKAAGAQVRLEEAESFGLDGPIKTVKTSAGQYEAKTVILAQGSSRRKLGIPGEEEFQGRGVSYCATCDGNFFRGRTVAVVGGGNTAVGDAIELAALCKKVYLLHRRDILRAELSLVKRAEELPNLEMVFSVQPVRIGGGAKVERIVVRQNGAERAIPLDGVFVAVGVVPNIKNLPPSLPVADGYLDASETGVTPVPGVFVAGDLRRKELYQIVTAVADGANAAHSAQHYLQR